MANDVNQTRNPTLHIRQEDRRDIQLQHHLIDYKSVSILHKGLAADCECPLFPFTIPTTTTTTTSFKLVFHDQQTTAGKLQIISYNHRTTALLSQN
jgi:hypothetical protein